MTGSPTPVPPDSPADMEEVKSICSLIQAGSVTWTDLAAFHSSTPVKVPDWTYTPAEGTLIRNLRAKLAAKHGSEQNFQHVTDMLIIHLFYRELSQLPPAFKKCVEALKPSA